MIRTRSKRLLITKLISYGVLSVIITFMSLGTAVAQTPTGSCNGRIIVKYKQAGKSTAQLSRRQINQLQIANGGKPVLSHRVLTNGARLLQRGQNSIEQSDAEFIKQLNQDPDIEYAECDTRRHVLYSPNDPQFPGNIPDYLLQQWYLLDSNPGGISADLAWELTRNTALAPTVVAVVDTGIANLGTAQLHEDLAAARILAGRDFVSSDSDGRFLTANDGDGWDDDASDPGDFVTTSESTTPGTDLTGCEVMNSSWHGTGITGIIAGEYDNGLGIAGIDQNSRILPVRVLGKCGGFTSDIAEGIRWAAGLPVNGVPTNSNPANVINLSFGSEAPCSQTEQDAIDDAVNAGALVVISAGNEGAAISNIAPANCDNVVVVSATTQQGGRSCYTNTGPEADLAAPGGNYDFGGSGCAGAPGDAIISIANAGSAGPSPANNSYAEFVGSSFSAPMVSAAAALIKASNTSLINTEIEALLVSTAKTFPTGTGDGLGDCNKQLCGNGILDIQTALENVASVDITPDAFSFTNQDNVALNATATSNSITISGITILSPISIAGGNYSINSGDYTAVDGWIAAGDTVTVQLNTSSTGSTAQTATLTIGGVSSQFTAITRSSSANVLAGNGNGGGSFSWLILCCLLAVIRLKIRQQ